MALTGAERARLCREKRKKDPVREAAYKLKRKDVTLKVPKISKKSPAQQKEIRKKWRERTRKSRAKKKLQQLDEPLAAIPRVNTLISHGFMDSKNQNLVIVKEEWVPDHVMEETPEEHPSDPLSFRLKEEPIDHVIDYSGCTPMSSYVDMKSRPEFHSEIETSEPTSGPSEVPTAQPVKIEPESPSKIQTTQPVKSGPESQSIGDRSDEIDSCRGLSEPAVNAYFCKICDYRSTHVGNFNRHVKHHDAKTKPGKVPKARLYDCELCGYKCSEFVRLKRHMMTHTGEKPLACAVCDFRTSHSNDLQRHMMVHTGEKPYACDLCDYKSSDVRNLKRHKLTHTGEKPYACDLCGYKSRTSHHLNRHKKMRHKVNTETPAT